MAPTDISIFLPNLAVNLQMKEFCGYINQSIKTHTEIYYQKYIYMAFFLLVCLRPNRQRFNINQGWIGGKYSPEN